MATVAGSATLRWDPGPARPHLRPDAVEVWACDLDRWREHERCLSPGERARAQRIVREPARTRWIAARGFLRALLASYLDARPQELALAVAAGGKPYLAHPGAPHFNLSHSGPLALVAISGTLAVGVDVELVTERRRAREQLGAWVVREARGKLAGVGLAGPASLAARDESEGSVVELAPREDAIAALATERPPRLLRRFSWPRAAA